MGHAQNTPAFPIAVRFVAAAYMLPILLALHALNTNNYRQDLGKAGV